VTGEVRDWDARGRHTSVHRQLLLCGGGGLLIDTPGMRELQLWDRTDTLEEAFPDIAELAAGCRFRDCGHEQEPGCAVKAAVAAGKLSGERCDAYLLLAAERHATDEARVERARADQKRDSKVQSRSLRKMQKGRGR
jgi:ribosome biogenesis GTPase